MFKIFATLFLAVGFSQLPARADGPILVEVFAAENCKASGRAQNIMTELEEGRDDVFVLTWPVNYWDYLGKEPLALEASNTRQKAYVDRFELRGPYTPQAVFNGVDEGVGSRREQVVKKVEQASEIAPSEVALSFVGDGISISGPDGAEGDVYIIHYLDDDMNPSRMFHPVSEVKRLLHWAGEDVQIDSNICHGSCVLLVQEADYGSVLATMPFRR